MTSITAQQTKLDLELVPKENRLDIGKCNRRIPHGLKPKEETFQVVLDALALTPCHPAFVITASVLKVYMNQFEDQDFDALPSEEDTVSFLRELGHTGLSIRSMMLLSIRYINRRELLLLLSTEAYLERLLTLFIRLTTVATESKKRCTTLDSQKKEASQKYGAVLPECLTSPQMKESKAYKTYLGYAAGTVPPKVARKFKKVSPSKKDSIVIREPPVETQSKRKEKVDVAHHKGIDLILEVALTEEAQMKEVRKKSLRDFHKSHPSGSGSVAKKPPSVKKITPLVTIEGTGDNPGASDMTRDDSIESESESWGNDDDDRNDEEGSKQENDSEEHESDSEQDTDGSESDSEFDQQDDDDEVKDDDNDDDDEDDNDDDKSEGDEDRGMDSDDIQDKKADVGMTDAQ
nr:hypothetical protein [Tanacetum cinerariifolium]